MWIHVNQSPLVNYMVQFTLLNSEYLCDITNEVKTLLKQMKIIGVQCYYNLFYGLKNVAGIPDNTSIQYKVLL